MTRYISEANLKFLGILVTVIIGVGGILFNFYKLQQSMALEARRPFLEKQLEICFEATNAVAAIAADVNAPPGDEAPIDTFKRLYLGSLALVENNKVACAMTRFNRELGTTNDPKYQRIGQIPVDCPEDVPELQPAAAEDVPELQSAAAEDVPKLQPAALEVAWACRELIIKSWGAELPVDLLVDPGAQ